MIVLYIFLGLLAALLGFILFVVISGLLVDTSKEYDKVLPFDDASYEAFCDNQRLLISKIDGGIITELE